MRWEQLTQSDNVAAAEWIREALHPFARDVGSVIPPGFRAYARIFHPARRRAGPDGETAEVRWSEVAEANERTVHPEMQFHAIAVPRLQHRQAESVWEFAPKLGAISRTQMVALVPLLNRYTSTPDRCWLCLWEGYGYLHAGAIQYFWAVKKGPGRALRPKVQRPPAPHLKPSRVRLPHRDYVLFIGPVAQAVGWEDGPNLWWPEDRKWCVASEIDFAYTYVGGSAELIAEILDEPLLEAAPASVTDGITFDSDKVNA